MADELDNLTMEQQLDLLKRLQAKLGVNTASEIAVSPSDKANIAVPKSTGKDAYKSKTGNIRIPYSVIATPEGKQNVTNTASTKVKNIRVTNDYVDFATDALRNIKDEAELRKHFADNGYIYAPSVTKRIVNNRDIVNRINAILGLKKDVENKKKTAERYYGKKGLLDSSSVRKQLAKYDEKISGYEKNLDTLKSSPDRDPNLDVNEYINVSALPEEEQADIWQQYQDLYNKGLLKGAEEQLKGSKYAGTNDELTDRYRALTYRDMDIAAIRDMMNDQSIAKNISKWNGKGEKPFALWSLDDADLNKGRMVVHIVGAPDEKGERKHQVKLVPFGAKLKTFQDNLQKRFGDNFETKIMVNHPNSAYKEGTPEELNQWLQAIKTGDWSQTKLPATMNIPKERAELMNMFNLNSDYYEDPEKFKQEWPEIVQRALDEGYDSYADYLDAQAQALAEQKKIQHKQERDQKSEENWKARYASEHPDVDEETVDNAYRRHIYTQMFNDRWAETNEDFMGEAEHLGKHYARMTKLRNNINKTTDYAKKLNDYIDTVNSYGNTPGYITRDSAFGDNPAGLYRKDDKGVLHLIAEKPVAPLEFTKEYLKSIQEGRSGDIVDRWQSIYNNIGGDALYNRLGKFFESDPEYADGKTPKIFSVLNQYLGASPKDATKTANIGRNALYWEYNDDLPENTENPYLAQFPVGYRLVDKDEYNHDLNDFLTAHGVNVGTPLRSPYLMQALANRLRRDRTVKRDVENAMQDRAIELDMNRGLTPEQIAKNKEIMKNAGTIIPNKRKENMSASERMADDITQASADKKEDEGFTAKLNAKKAAASSYTKFMNAFAKENSTYSKDELKKMMPRGVYEKRVNSGGEDAARTYLSNRVANADKQKEAQKQQNGITAAVTPFGMKYEPKSDVSDDTLLYGEKSNDFGGNGEDEE